MNPFKTILPRIFEKLTAGRYGRLDGRRSGMIGLLCSFWARKYLRLGFLRRIEFPDGAQGRAAGGDALTVAFQIPGALGDALIALQWVQAVIREFGALAPDARFFVLAKNPGLAASLTVLSDPRVSVVPLGEYRKEPFDIFIVSEENSFLERLCPEGVKKRAPALYAARGDNLRRFAAYSREARHYRKFLYHGLLMEAALARGLDRMRINFENGLLGDPRVVVAGVGPGMAGRADERAALLARLGLAGRRFVTLHCGVGGVPTKLKDFDPAECTRIPPPELLGAAAALLRERFPDLVFVQIGGAESPAVPGTDLNLLGKTALRESAFLLAEAALHIGGDSGLMHLRHMAGRRSLILWGPTRADFTGYAEDVNLTAGDCSGCMWHTREWNVVCPATGRRGRPPCMTAFRAEDVAAAAARVLAG